MTDDFIQLKDKDLLRLEIKTSDGKSTGNFLEFDLEDVGLMLRFQELVEKDKKNKINLQNQLMLIEKRQDVKGKKLLSKNAEDKIRALNEFYNKEKEVYNMFLGENGVEKLLNGRALTWESFADIDEIIEKQILPHINIKMDKITQKIKAKYGKKQEEEIEVLK